MSEMPVPQTIKCVFVIGPTATGKTRLGVSIARTFSGEIISADSRQIYRGMDIGTGKDLDEYTENGPRVPYHLIDIVDPSEDYHLFRFLQDARRAIQSIIDRHKLPVVVGGTPLYVNALLNDYTLTGGPPDPKLRLQLEQLPEEQLLKRLRDTAPDIFNRTDKSQRRRIIRALEMALTRPEQRHDTPPLQLNPLLLAPYYHRSVIHQRIEQRLDERLKHGLVEEAEALNEQGLSWERLDFFGLEYRFAAHFLQGHLNRSQMRDQLLAKIRRFCKSQDGWFRKMEREGKIIHWIPEGDPSGARDLVSSFLAGEKLPPPPVQLKNILYGPQTS